MAKFNEYPAKTTPKDADKFMLYSAEDAANKLIDYDKLADAVLNKLTSKIFTLAQGNITLIEALNKLNSNQVFNNLLIYRTSGSNIKSVTISINKEGYNDIRYAPFTLFGGSVFLTGTIESIDNTLKTGDVTIEYNDNDSMQNVKFSNFPQYVNAVIIIYYENIKNAIVKEK